MKIAHFWEIFRKKLFFIRSIKAFNKKCLKINSEQIFGNFLWIACFDLAENRISPEIPINEQFLLHKVQKMTNKFLFSIKSKMLTIYGFHMDFKFWSKKVLPRDFQMRLTHPWLWEGCDWCGMDPKSLKMDFRDLYRSGHVWLSVVLVYPNLSTFWTHPNDHCSG